MFYCRDVASTIEYEIRNILFNIWLFKLFKPSKYNKFVITPLIIVLFLFFGGLLISCLYNLLHFFLKLKIYYLLLTAIFFALVAFQWFIINYPKMLASIFPIFNITEDEYISKLNETKIVKKNPILIITSLAISLFGIIMAIFSWSNPETLYSPIWTNIPSNTIIDIYILTLIGICGILLGTGLLGYLDSLWMISKICQFEIDLVKIYLLQKLTNFNNVFIFWGIMAIIFFIFLVFENYTLINLLFVMFGSVVVLLAFSMPQIYFHFSIIKSKNKELEKITDIYKTYYYNFLNNSDVNNNDLLILESLQNIRTDIEKTRTYFYDFGSIISFFIGGTLPSITLWLISKFG